MTNALLFASFSHILMIGKVSFIVGSKAAFFSLAQCLTPLVGRYAGVRTSFMYLAIRTLLKTIIVGSFSSLLLVYHIPSFFQNLYCSWIIPHGTKPKGPWAAVFLCALCLCCITLFVFHETGRAAFPYAFFWVLPAIMPFIKTDALFMHVLASTFVAHAVGSVIWLYTHQTTPALWLALIPVVCVERLLFATGTVILIRVYDNVPPLLLKKYALKIHKFLVPKIL